LLKNNNATVLTLDSSQNATFAGITTIQTDGGNEQLVIKRASNTNEQLILGFHSSDYGQIQAVEQGVAFRNLALNPNGGNVCIGTTTGEKLTVAGAIKSTARAITTSSTPGVTLSYDSSNSVAKIETWTSKPFSIETAGAERLRIDNSGRVGIGTTSPEAKLDVDADSNQVAFMSRDQGSATYPAFGFAGQIDSNGNRGTGIFLPTDGALGFAAHSAERMRVNPTGVGIGTTSPSALLHLASAGPSIVLEDTDNNPDYEIKNGNGSFRIIDTTNSADRININSSGGVGIGTTNPSDVLHVVGDIRINSNTPHLKFTSADNSSNSYYIGANISDSVDGGLQIGEGTALGSNVRLAISGSGNVGIGLTSPATNLHLVASSPQIRLQHSGNSYFSRIITDSSNNLLFGTGSNGAERMRIDSSGRVGIGETAPITNNKIHAKLADSGVTSTSNQSVAFFENNTNAWLTIGSGTTSYGGILFADSGDNDVGQVRYDHGNDQMQFIVNAGQVFRIEEDGVVVTGDLSKSSGSFKIDHPLKPETHHLVHSFVEGPQADNLYRGTINLEDGKATIDLDEWFGMTPGTFLALNRDIQAFVSNVDDWDAVRAKMMGSQLVIECQNTASKASVSWLVVGERQDKEIYASKLTDDNGKIIVEPLKEVVE
jgi:hypothetical protein